MHPALAVQHAALALGGRERPVDQIDVAGPCKDNAPRIAVRARPERTLFPEIDQHAIEAVVAQQLGNAIRQVTLPHSVQGDPLVAPKADNIGLHFNLPPVHQAERLRNVRPRRDIGGRRDREPIDVHLPQGLDCRIEQAAGGASDRQRKLKRLSHIAAWLA
jgi:hypothetical protein